MESNVHSYQLTQKNKSYVLTTSVVGNELKISCKSTTGASMTLTRTFTIETWKKIGAVFETIQTPLEAVEWIDKTLKVHKVKIIEEGSMFKLVFFIIENRIKHLVEIPLSEGGQINTNIATSSISASTSFNNATVIDTKIDTSNTFNTQEITTTNIDTSNTYNAGEIATANIDTSNTYNAGEIASTNIDTASFNYNTIGTQSQYMQQGTIDTTTTTTTVNTDFKSSAELGIDPSKIVRQTLNENTQEIINSIEDEKKLRLSQVGKIINEPFKGDIKEFGQFQITEKTDKIDLNQYTTTSQDTAVNYQEYQSTTTTAIPNIATQYTETNTQISNVVESTPIEPVTNNYNLPFITPADAPQTTTEIKTETTPVDFNLESYTQNYNNEINYSQFQTTVTATNDTQFDSQNYAQDDRLIKLEGETNTLKNEHQEIQTKLTNLYNQVNSYKNQLDNLQNENNSRELSALRAENAAIKQQLAELERLRAEASQVNILRSQVAEIDPLRRKAAELDSLRNQLNELNMLKAKVAELSGYQNQLGELNNLKTQISQMNYEKQQKEEIDEKEMLKRKLEELERLRTEYETEIRTLKESKMTKIQESSGLQKQQHLFEDKTRQISVKGDIIHSTEELELITRKINKANKKITLNLLYKATVDSDKAQAFHEKCDEAKSSLVLVETDKGKRFGGFTSCSWSGDCEDKKDEEAFVFSLDKMAIYENIPGEEAIGCYPKFGPIFLGCQIRIYDNAFSKGGTTFEKGLNFNTEEDYELTGGDRSFIVKEIEVYEVIAQ